MMGIGTVDDVYVEDLFKQPDGRYTLIFKENGKLWKQENIAICSVGYHKNDTGNDRDLRMYQVMFETLTCYHPPKEL